MENKLYKDWSDDDKKDYRDWLSDNLRSGPVTVYFLKKDGSERAMRCTLNEKDVVLYEKKTDRVTTVSDEVRTVYDLEKNEWRCFRYDSITKVELALNGSD